MSLDPLLIDSIKAHFAYQSSAQLQKIVQSNDQARWSAEAIAAACELLQDRKAGRAQEPLVAEEERPPRPSPLDPSIETEYPLRLSRGRVLAMVGCVVGVTVGLVLIAVNNSRGLHVVGIVTLSAQGATLFYWIWAAACGLFVLPTTLAVAWRGAFIKQRIRFTRSSIWIPRTNWSEQLVEIPFGEILSASVWSFRNERVVTLVLANRKFRVGQSWLPSPAAFEDVMARLEAGMRASKE